MLSGAVSGYGLRNLGTASAEPTIVCDRYHFRHGEAHPGQSVPVLREFDGPREQVDMRWGLIPFAARGDPGEQPLIHAPLLGLADSHIYRGPWLNGQRCLQLATSYQFWRADDQGRRCRWQVRARDHEVFGLAALWDRSQPASGAMIESCALVTLPDGMPVILGPDQQAAWLTGTTMEAAALLVPFPEADLHVTPM
jgi:putative SOS response-associated peptidase YedK